MSSADAILATARARKAAVSARTTQRLAKLGADSTPSERAAVLEKDERAIRKIIALWRANPRYAPSGRVKVTVPSGRVTLVGEKDSTSSSRRSLEKRPFRASQRKAVAS